MPTANRSPKCHFLAQLLPPPKSQHTTSSRNANVPRQAMGSGRDKVFKGAVFPRVSVPPYRSRPRNSHLPEDIFLFVFGRHAFFSLDPRSVGVDSAGKSTARSTNSKLSGPTGSLDRLWRLRAAPPSRTLLETPPYFLCLQC